MKLLFPVAIGVCISAAGHADAPAAPREIDLRRAEAAGIRVLEGRHLRLFTDVPANAAVDELPAVFDAAVPQWADYFHVRPEVVADAKWQACLIADRDRFAALGLLPADNPNFLNGYARDWELWLVEQPSDYYRRHLLLHEGTHAFMQTQLGGCGAPWYMEGMAELLGTHGWREGRLKLGIFPANKNDVPMWGRVKLVREAFATNRAWPIEQVLRVDNSRTLSTEHYAWTWALAALLDRHPQFQGRFRTLQGNVTDANFTAAFRRAFAKDWSDLLCEWAACVAEMDYGFDISRMAMVHRESEAVGEHAKPVEIAADRGWQSTGWLLRAGQTYRVTAGGRFQIAYDTESWPCEPGGVTIEYHNGRPLGALLGALRPVDQGEMAASGDPSFARPALLGLQTTIRPTRDSVLYVRVNDSPAMLADNAGELTVEIERVGE